MVQIISSGQTKLNSRAQVSAGIQESDSRWDTRITILRESKWIPARHILLYIMITLKMIIFLPVSL